MWPRFRNPMPPRCCPETAGCCRGAGSVPATSPSKGPTPSSSDPAGSIGRWRAGSFAPIIRHHAGTFHAIWPATPVGRKWAPPSSTWVPPALNSSPTRAGGAHYPKAPRQPAVRAARIAGRGSRARVIAGRLGLLQMDGFAAAS